VRHRDDSGPLLTKARRRTPEPPGPWRLGGYWWRNRRETWQKSRLRQRNHSDPRGDMASAGSSLVAGEDNGPKRRVPGPCRPAPRAEREPTTAVAMLLTITASPLVRVVRASPSHAGAATSSASARSKEPLNCQLARSKASSVGPSQRGNAEWPLTLIVHSAGSSSGFSVGSSTT